MLDQWRERFARDGVVEIHGGRGRLGGASLAGGLVAAVAGLYLLMTPVAAGFLPLGLLRVSGVVALGGAAVAVAFGLRMLVSPRLIVRLDHQGLAPGGGPPVRWDEVEGADTTRVGGLELARVRVADSYWARAREVDAAAARKLERYRSVAGPRRVLLQAGAPGGGQALMRLILWARDRQGAAGG